MVASGAGDVRDCRRGVKSRADPPSRRRGPGDAGTVAGGGGAAGVGRAGVRSGAAGRRVCCVFHVGRLPRAQVTATDKSVS